MDINAFDPQTTDQSQLRGGRSPWRVSDVLVLRAKIRCDMACDILIVGGGITGALMAEHLTRSGRQVCVIDRERPGMGSTAASTAMLQWEIDCSLGELTDFYGFERAANIYRRSLGAVAGLKQLVADLGLPSEFRDRSSLYIASGKVGARELAAEHALRKRAELPGEYLDYLTLKGEFAVDREAAILSPGSADADPLQLAHALLSSAVAGGAQLFDAEATAYDQAGGNVMVTLDSGHVIEAGNVVLATGYVMPDFVTSDLHKTSSSWAIATPPQDKQDLWRDETLIWEADEPYIYARTTREGRIVIGGEDEDRSMSPDERDLLMPEKSRIIVEKLKNLWPRANVAAEFVWSGAFGETADGLPLIGRVPGWPGIYAAYGYGGNGITFSFMASRIIASMLAGDERPWFDEFALDRASPVE
jgi:glycine/D-amino acid oxidase-like deaminating enzyme